MNTSTGPTEGERWMTNTTHTATGTAAWLLASLILFLAMPASAADEETLPNIVIIVIDDAAFTDLGAYGSEINTPNIDTLASEGAMFSNFHAAPTCAPSRAMLMTGVPSHRAGLATLGHLRPPEHDGFPEYQGELAADVPTLAEHLKQAGYATYATGKWHLGQSPQSLPSARGFDRTFILDSSGADNWEDRSYLPQYEQADWFADGQRTSLPDDFYSSEFLVDRMIDFIGETAEDQPFLSYIGFQAIHIPIQAPREFTERYNGVYDEGWEAHRQRRHQAAIDRGLVPETAVLAPAPEVLRGWESLSRRERERAIRSMQVNAGMLEAMDYHVGRLMAHLREIGQYDNTLFVVVSDNGPEHNDPTANLRFRLWLRLEGYSLDLETLGERGSYAAIGPEWALANAAPGALFKFHASEGGTRVPFILSGPGIGAEQLLHPFSFISDITPTLLELTGVPRLPQGPAFTGRSLADLLQGRADYVYGPDDPVVLEASGQSAVFRGDYKLVRNLDQYGDGVWRLHNIRTDPGEAFDLADEQPERFERMLADYDAFAAEYGIQPMPPSYSGTDLIVAAGRDGILRSYGRTLLLFALAAFAIVVLSGLLLWQGWRRLYHTRTTV